MSIVFACLRTFFPNAKLQVAYNETAIGSSPKVFLGYGGWMICAKSAFDTHEIFLVSCPFSCGTFLMQNN